MVLASKPVASVIRLAARPGGAHNKSRTPFAARMRRMALTMVVLPTPGPPVMTSTLETRASLMAIAWLSARTSPTRCAIHGQRLIGIDPRPRERAIGEPMQPFGNDALGAMKPGQKDTGRFADAIGDDRAPSQLEIECGANQLQRHFKKSFRSRHQFV